MSPAASRSGDRPAPPRAVPDRRSTRTSAVRPPRSARPPTTTCARRAAPEVPGRAGVMATPGSRRPGGTPNDPGPTIP